MSSFLLSFSTFPRTVYFKVDSEVEKMRPKSTEIQKLRKHKKKHRGETGRIVLRSQVWLWKKGDHMRRGKGYYSSHTINEGWAEVENTKKTKKEENGDRKRGMSERDVMILSRCGEGVWYRMKKDAEKKTGRAHKWERNYKTGVVVANEVRPRKKENAKKETGKAYEWESNYNTSVIVVRK